MSFLETFLQAARRRVLGRRSALWFVRGLLVAATAAVAAQLLARVWPAWSRWPVLASAGALGAAVAAAGNWRRRPGITQVARTVDRELDGAERVATAWELTHDRGPMAVRQRDDARAWVAGVSAGQIRLLVPRWEVALACTAALFAVGVSLVPNPAAARAKADAARRTERQDVAREIEQAAERVGALRPEENPGRRRILLRELDQAARDVRRAPDTEAAVAALSRTQQALRSLAGHGGTGRLEAASSAGAELAAAAESAAAGRALAAQGAGMAEDLRSAADGLPSLAPEERRAVQASLDELAQTAGDGQLGEALQQAAAALADGRTAAAGQALEHAAQLDAARRGDATLGALDALAGSLAGYSPEQRTALAQALDRAAAAAQPDPGLSQDLGRAAQALQEGRKEDASSALADAGRRAEALDAEIALDRQAAQAANALEVAKDRLLEQEEDAQGKQDSARRQGEAGETGRQAQPGRQGQPAQGSQPGRTGGQGQPGPGSEERQSGGREPGRGNGPGEGDSGGSESSGSSGALGQRPGSPSEQVFVPGIDQGGHRQTLPGREAGGLGGGLVPYESVYREYRATALSQADRQLIPERRRDLLRQYFQDPR